MSIKATSETYDKCRTIIDEIKGAFIHPSSDPLYIAPERHSVSAEELHDIVTLVGRHKRFKELGLAITHTADGQLKVSPQSRRNAA